MDHSLTDTGEPPTYRSYLLRLWREEQAGEPWRASLQSVATGERQGFASLDDLFGYIRSQVKATPDLFQDAGEMAASESR